MSKENEIKECDQLINRYILRARNFIDYSCFQEGKYQYAISKKINPAFISDFQYFAFTKSTKSLESIRALLDLGHIEDVFVIARTIFECYIASRYFDEEYDETLVNDFIFTPQLIAQQLASYNSKTKTTTIHETNDVIEYIHRNPSNMKLGKDKKYYYDLYSYLCSFTHCNFSTLYYYIDDQDCYTCDKITNAYLSRVIVLFIYTKLFESIVTIEGEDFFDEHEEKMCYELVETATKFIYEQLDYFSNYICEDVGARLNNHMKEMFKHMKNSLKEELGNVKKDFL